MTFLNLGHALGGKARLFGSLLTAALPLALLLVPASASAQASGPVPVEAAKVAIGPLGEHVTAVGSLLSNESVVIRSEVAGRVEEIHFEEGKPIKRGDKLFSLDDSVYRAALDEAEARLKLAERNNARTEELFSNKYASARSRDEALSSVEIGRATVELARVRLEKMTIRAPFDGIVGLRRVSVGDYINVGEDLVNLENITPIKVDFRVAEKFLPAVRTGQSISIRVDAFPEQTFEGEVYAIDPKLDAQGRSILIRARVPNADEQLRPGLFARVTLMLELKPQALTIPEQAIVPRGGDQYVYKVVDGKASQIKVRTGIRRDGQVEIVSGLADGDTVVTAGQLKIRDGASVKVLNGDDGAGTG